jgi:hypothetical protein
VTRASISRRERRLQRQGRPKGSSVRLLDDEQRFSIAAWAAFGEMGLGPLVAAELALVLIESDGPVSIEDIDGVLVNASAKFTGRTTTLKKRADWLARKSRTAITQSNDLEHAWIVEASGVLRALIHFIAADNLSGAARSFDLLAQLGWEPTLTRLQRRFDAAVRTNLPPYEGKLSAAARRLLAHAREQQAKNDKPTNRF